PRHDEQRTDEARDLELGLAHHAPERRQPAKPPQANLGKHQERAPVGAKYDSSASTSPARVERAASTVAGKPHRARVSEVTGPIEARQTRSIAARVTRVRGSPGPSWPPPGASGARNPRAARKCSAVDELAKVTASISPASI